MGPPSKILVLLSDNLPAFSFVFGTELTFVSPLAWQVGLPETDRGLDCRLIRLNDAESMSGDLWSRPSVSGDPLRLSLVISSIWHSRDGNCLKEKCSSNQSFGSSGISCFIRGG